MKRSAFILIAFLAMAGVACAAPVLSVVDNGVVDNGVSETALRSFTVVATGTGIVQLGEFEITEPPEDPDNPPEDPVLATVYQNFYYNYGGGDPYQVESTLSPHYVPGGDGDYNPEIDSHVLFGEQRVPDLVATLPWPGPGGEEERPDCFTTETLDDPDLIDDMLGWGTLTNSTDIEFESDNLYDTYFLEGPPPTVVDEEVELIQLVIEDLGEDVFPYEIALTLYTAIDYDEYTGAATLEAHELEYGVPRLVGDCDGDGDCDFDDFVAFGTGWFGPDGDGATNPEPPASWEVGDFDGDGDVDFDDFVAFGTGWFSEYGDGGPGVAVPEPSTMVMLILGGLCLIGYRLRR